jgi:hypothetical protein
MDSAIVSFPRRRLGDRDDEDSCDNKSFVLPCVADPAAFAERHFNVYKGDQDGELKMKFAKGTTVRLISGIGFYELIYLPFKLLFLISLYSQF